MARSTDLLKIVIAAAIVLQVVHLFLYASGGGGLWPFGSKSKRRNDDDDESVLSRDGRKVLTGQDAALQRLLEQVEKIVDGEHDPALLDEANRGRTPPPNGGYTTTIDTPTTTPDEAGLFDELLDELKKDNDEKDEKRIEEEREEEREREREREKARKAEEARSNDRPVDPGSKFKTVHEQLWTIPLHEVSGFRLFPSWDRLERTSRGGLDWTETRARDNTLVSTWRQVEYNETYLYLWDEKRNMRAYVAPRFGWVGWGPGPGLEKGPKHTLGWAIPLNLDQFTKTAMRDSEDNPHRAKSYLVTYNAQSNSYFEFQVRYSKYWWDKSGQKPNGRWLRLLSHPNPEGDHLMPWLPTFVAKPYQSHYLPFNKPYSLLQMFEQQEVEEEVIVLIDPDCAILEDLSPWTRLVEKGYPIGQKGYMTFGPMANDNFKAVAERYCHGCNYRLEVQALAVPIYMHRDDMRALLPKWMEKLVEIIDDKPNWPKAWTEYEVALHWCAEMFAYIFASAEMGLRHIVYDQLQILGTQDALTAPIIHYSLPIRIDHQREWHKKDAGCGELIPWPLPDHLNPVARLLMTMLRDANKALGFVDTTISETRRDQFWAVESNDRELFLADN